MKVVAVSSRIPTEPYYRYHEFVASLAKFKVEPVILGMGQPWMGLMTKPLRIRDWLRENRDGRIIYCDAWDVVFQRSPELIDEWCQKEHGDAVVFNCEKACWPKPEWTDHFPDTGSPWRFLNGGAMCGPASRILEIMEWMDVEKIGFDTATNNPNDQIPYQQAYIEKVVPIALDTKCHMMQCLHSCDLSEFDFEDPVGIRNRLTNSYPGAFHCNGGAKEIFQPTLFARLGL